MVKHEGSTSAEAEGDKVKHKGATVRQTERFIGMVAHDLANPISTILYAAEGALAQPPGRDDDVKTSLRRIVKTTKRMRGIVERLLDFTRVGTGKGLPLHRQHADLRDLSEQAVAELEERYPRRITVVNVGDLTGDWDTGRLLEVLSNLLTNALVHGCFGCPVGLVLDGAQPQTVEVRVHNRGDIPASRLPTLFDPF